MQKKYREHEFQNLRHLYVQHLEDHWTHFAMSSWLHTSRNAECGRLGLNIFVHLESLVILLTVLELERLRVEPPTLLTNDGHPETHG